MAHDPNDARQVNLAKQIAKRREARAADDVVSVMDTDAGRRFVNGVIGLSGVRADIYVPGGQDAARQQDYLLGRRSVGLELLDQIELHAPQQTELMTAEARVVAAAQRAEDEAAELLFAGEDSQEPQEQTDG